MVPLSLAKFSFNYPAVGKQNSIFITWYSYPYVWHMSKQFKNSKYKIYIVSTIIDKTPLRCHLYLRAIRQYLWRKFKNVKGFIPLLGLNKTSGELIFAVKAVLMNNNHLETEFLSFIDSKKHKDLLRYVCSV